MFEAMGGSLALECACVDEKKLRSLAQIAAGDFVVYTPFTRAGRIQTRQPETGLAGKNLIPADSELGGIQN